MGPLDPLKAHHKGRGVTTATEKKLTNKDQAELRRIRREIMRLLETVDRELART